jgi:hypothetical protein
LFKQSALTEKGQVVNGFGDMPNTHDMLTGSQADGRAYTDNADHTCNNWTSSGMGTRSSAIRTAAAAATRRGIRRIKPRLQSGGSCRHRRSRLVLLFRDELNIREWQVANSA